MIFKTHLVLFVLVYCLPCTPCDDDVSASRKTTIAMSTVSNCNFRSAESLESKVDYNPECTENFTTTESLENYTKFDSESIKDLYHSTTYETTMMSTTNSYSDDEINETPTTTWPISTATQSTTTKSMTDQSTTSQSTTIKSTTDQSTTGQSTTGQSTTTKSTTDQSTTDQSTTTKSTTGQSTTTKSTTDQSTTTWPTTIDTTTFSSTTDTICSNWPINATEDTMEVIDLNVTSISTEWITLTWDTLCKNSMNSSKLMYVIERCDSENNCNETYEYDIKHNATNLNACTSYIFTIKINVTDQWESNGVNVSAATSNSITEIGDVHQLSVNEIHVDAVQLTWLPPAKHAKCISNYFITYCDWQYCNETVALTANYTVNDLEPCTEYRFNVKTMTEVVESIGVNVSAKTASPKLSEPQSVTITPSNFSLDVKWKPPQSGSMCLKYYRVSVKPGRFTFNTTDTNITISNLNSCVTYTVNIIAVNEDDNDGNVSSKTEKTTRTVTNRPVPHAGDLTTTTTISMIWSIEKENNHCQLTSIITICNYTASNGTGYDLVNGMIITKIEPESATSSVVVKNTTVSGLSPFTSYSCQAYTVNTAGFSELSDKVSAQTMEDVSSPPKISIKNVADMQFSLIWDAPDCLPGYIENFEITFSWRLLFPVPNWCHKEMPEEDIVIKVNGSMRSYDYHNAKPFTKYTVTIRAKTGAGWSNFSAPQVTQTHNGIPGAISKFTYTIKENVYDTNKMDTILTWALPCSLNGELELFNISVYGTRDRYKPHSFFVLDKCANYVSTGYMCSRNLEELKGEYNYTFAISTKVSNVEIPGPAMSQTGIIYPAGIPPQPDEEYINWITIDPYRAIRSTTTASILLPLFPDTSGNIKYYAIMISEEGYNEQSSMRFDINSKTWPNTSSWEEAMASGFSITYQATRPKWNPYPDYVADYGHIKAVKYVIGEDITCKEISSNTDKRLYCNGPLKPNTWYHVRMRAFTCGGYTDSKLFVIKTNAETNVVIVVGTVFGILFLGILTTMMLLVRKCSPYILFRRFLHSDMPGSPVPAPFTRKKFIAHCQQLVDNPGKLSNEFRLLQTLSVDLQMPTNSACLQANRKKNRYSDILPYDFSRVKLNVIDNDPNTDYINASFIRGYTGEDEYIACQGPKEETTYDFWRMVDQYNINLIVMLTQLVEKGKEKCHQYYPTIKETFRYENMTIRCTSELDFRTHTQRTLVLQKENKKRNIIHLHFKDWPDHDVPEDFDPMINFCQIVRRNIIADKGFVVVHCSAGIGRTGTLIAIDILLQHLRDNRKLDVFGTVYRLRHHRINMVQRESQYAYIYNCIKQVLKNPYFLKTYKPPPVDPVYENISKRAKDTTNTDTNLVNLEILKKCNNSVSMESLESICNLFPWPNAKYQRNTTANDLRHYKSMDAINVKTHHNTIGKSRTLERVTYKPLNLKDSPHKLNRDNVTQENYPLITYSKSVGDVLSSQYALDSTM